MLSKRVCQQCGNRVSWGEKDEEMWVRDLRVFCYVSTIRGKRPFRILPIYFKPPEWCPYWLEHVMEAENGEKSNVLGSGSEVAGD